jgi:hypothetical protein
MNLLNLVGWVIPLHSGMTQQERARRLQWVRGLTYEAPTAIM